LKEKKNLGKSASKKTKIRKGKEGGGERKKRKI